MECRNRCSLIVPDHDLSVAKWRRELQPRRVEGCVDLRQTTDQTITLMRARHAFPIVCPADRVAIGVTNKGVPQRINIREVSGPAGRDGRKHLYRERDQSNR